MLPMEYDAKVRKIKKINKPRQGTSQSTPVADRRGSVYRRTEKNVRRGAGKELKYGTHEEKTGSDRDEPRAVNHERSFVCARALAVSVGVDWIWKWVVSCVPYGVGRYLTLESMILTRGTGPSLHGPHTVFPLTPVPRLASLQ